MTKLLSIETFGHWLLEVLARIAGVSTKCGGYSVAVAPIGSFDLNIE